MSFKGFGDRKEPFVGLVRIFPFIGPICWQKPSFLDESVLGFDNFVLAKNWVDTWFFVFSMVFKSNQVFNDNRLKLFSQGLLWSSIKAPEILVVKGRAKTDSYFGVLSFEKLFVFIEILILDSGKTRGRIYSLETLFSVGEMSTVLWDWVLHKFETDMAERLFWVGDIKSSEVGKIFFIIWSFIVLSYHFKHISFFGL